MSDGEARYHLMIRDIHPDERPRERLLNYGAASLSTTELLAIILNTGIQGESVTSIAQRLLSEHGGLSGLLKLDLAELARQRGVGPVKATKLKASLEIGRRLAAMAPEERARVESPEDVVRLVGVEMSVLEQEQLRVLLLDTKHAVIAARTIYQGSANQATVRVGELFRDAVRHTAVAIVLVHNHPSGDPTPSGADVAMTTDVVAAGKLLDIAILDHIIIGQGRHTSLKRLGLGFPPESNR
ncbi:MAG TPA: DNA repair protein RadC [Thermomicrobiales bacterium]|nr:DNA repair protein RadC [Thermomicrobiales bacterium]